MAALIAPIVRESTKNGSPFSSSAEAIHEATRGAKLRFVNKSLEEERLQALSRIQSRMIVSGTILTGTSQCFPFIPVLDLVHEAVVCGRMIRIVPCGMHMSPTRVGNLSSAVHDAIGGKS
jgi:hypothetical protein